MSKHSEKNEGLIISDDHGNRLLELNDSSSGYIQIQLPDYENSDSTLTNQQLENLDCIVIFPGNDAPMPLTLSTNSDQMSDQIISVSTSSNLSDCLTSTLHGASILPNISQEKKPKKSVLTKFMHSGSSDSKTLHDSSSIKNKCLNLSDVKRRVSHNEVERKRRDQINTWIGELQAMLPDEVRQKSYHQSKGVILKTVTEYFKGVQQYFVETQDLQSKTKQLEVQNAVLKESLSKLKQENDQLKLQVQHIRHNNSSSSDD